MHRCLSLTLLATQVFFGRGVAAQAPARWGDELPAPPSREPAPRTGPATLPAPAPPLTSPPSSVRALYVNAWAFGSSRFDQLVRLADTTEVNSLIIDVKDDTGYLTYRSEVPTAIAIGANRQLRARDAAARIRVLLAKGIHPIARIVVAKDPLLAVGRPSWAIQSTRGGLWHDRQGRPWVDAYSDSIWIYASELAAEAVRMGFAEVQYDYVRFPDESRSRLATAVFPGRHGVETSREGIARNLRLLGERTRPLGVPFTIDVFGLTTSAEGDLGIGQAWEDLVTTADVVLPMVYPSHYYRGFYDMKRPNFEPYRVVRRAIEDGLRRSKALGATSEIRPFLQAFTLGQPRYSPHHVREQIRAVADLGLPGWALWNPRSVYDPAIFRPESAGQGENRGGRP